MVPGWVVRALQVLLAIALVALVAGQLLGQPILLGFVETGSMESEIDAGDGFVSIPSELTGDPETGDVVVFEAEEIEGGGLTTHRVVDETDEGYVTKGDANPFTDQDGGEPPVQDEQIVAHAWQVDGSVVTIPALGTAVMTVGDELNRIQLGLAGALGTSSLLGPMGIAYLIFGLSIVLYAVETIRERRKPDYTSRLGRTDGAGIDPRYLCAGFALLVVVAAAGAMIVPAGSHSYDVVSAEFDSDRPEVIEQGTTDELPYEVANTGFVPIVSYVEAGDDAVAVEPDRTTVDARGDESVSVAITAPEETGYYPTYVTEYRYLSVLPAPVLDALHDVHPWAALGTILALLGTGTYAVGRLLLGLGQPHRRRHRTHGQSRRTQFRSR